MVEMVAGVVEMVAVGGGEAFLPTLCERPGCGRVQGLG